MKCHAQEWAKFYAYPGVFTTRSDSLAVPLEKET
jgi:hypothetical protein